MQAIPPPPINKNLAELQEQIHHKLVAVLDPEKVQKMPEERRPIEIRAVIEDLLKKDNIDLRGHEREEMIGNLLDESLGLGPLEKLLNDTTVSDILVNGPNQVYVERKGTLYESPVHFRDETHLLEIIRRIVHRVGRQVSFASPMVDARLPCGSRVNVIVAPLALHGPILSIRRFGVQALRVNDLLALKSLTQEMASFLEAAVKARLNILVSGGTGSGKTTLLNVLSSFISDRERIITIEDAVELQLQQRHVVQLETRPANLEGAGAFTMRDLLRNALRMRPDHIIVGECRGAEVMEMLQAMNTGHDGSMSTLHANGPRDALLRLQMMFMMNELDLPLAVIRQTIASAIDLIIHVERLTGGRRRVMNVTELVGMERDTITTQDLFVFNRRGVDAAGNAHGQFEAAGVRPLFMSRIEAAGMTFPPNFFQARVLLEA
ncbi:pilus assembly protein CpaF [Planctomycetaceae bacterium SCGC AG-212-F19]|nr:pilus assembly protein CpaF [Planctomycetaceae bacterium SCGC AG-212-F19]